MQLGTRQHLAFEILPLTPSWDISYKPEKAAWAGLAIWVGGENICRHIDPQSGSVQDYLCIPLGPIADWVVRSWPALVAEEHPRLLSLLDDDPRACYLRWTELSPRKEMSLEEWHEERWMWWQRHFLEAGVEGALVPDLALSRDGTDLVVSWAEVAPLTKSLRDEQVRRVDWASSAQSLREFVTYIGDTFKKSGLDDAYPWLKNADPLDVVLHESMERLLEFYTGQSIDGLRQMFGISESSCLAEALRIQGDTDPGASVLTQILRCLPGRAHTTLVPAMQQVDEAIDAHPMSSGAKHFRSELVQTASGVHDPEERGHELATALRQKTGMNGQPLSTDAIFELAGRCGLHFVDKLTFTSQWQPDVHGLLGSRTGFAAVAGLTKSKKMAAAWARRFEAARLLGVSLLSTQRGGALGWATSSWSSAQMRRCSGAFAAELLLPRSGAEAMVGGTLDDASASDVFQEIMDKYEIGASAAAFQLWNCKLLSSATLRDELIDEFSRVT